MSRIVRETNPAAADVFRVGVLLLAVVAVICTVVVVIFQALF